jgi:hypothetical protein
MATKRSGKAANRRSRHRPPRRPAIPQPAPRPPEDDTADAVDDTDAVAARSAPEPVRATPRPMPAIYAGASRLSERAAAEYHYVGRDLRNIVVLTGVMVVLLAAAAVAVNLLGITQP